MTRDPIRSSADRRDATVLVCTYNRAAFLDTTLASLASMRLPPGFTWDVLVVDNRSTDGTAGVVERHRHTFPVPLHYLYEDRQGKSYALNSGLTIARGDIIAFTDDDVEVAEGWLWEACRPMIERDDLAYTGGPVKPRWESPPPHWLDRDRGHLRGTIAITDHGPEPFVFEERRKIPMGVNMAVRREVFERIGGFRPDLGRRGNSLLGQEQAEFFCRSRAAGLKGLYVPAMMVAHYVPAARLTRSYFRRWWFWKGISKARLERLHTTTELGVDLERTPHLLGVPRFMYGSALRDLRSWAAALVSGRAADAARHEMMVMYFAGYFVARQRERERLDPEAPVLSRWPLPEGASRQA